MEQTQFRLVQLSVQLMQQMQIKINHLKYQLNSNLSTLHAVSPLATLDRGYAIATKKNKVLLDTHDLTPGDSIEVRLAKGSLLCDVNQIQD